MELRQYQKDALNGIIKSKRKGNKNILLQAATGSGKTVMASAYVKYCVEKGMKVLFLAHRRELITQCSEKLDAFNIKHGLIMAGKASELWHKVQVASIDTLRSRSLTNKREELPQADLVIIDEAHRCLSQTYLKLISLYEDSYILGLTATPVRTDGRGLGHIFQDMIQAPSIKWLTEVGSLVKADYYAPTIPDLRSIKSSMGDYNSVDLEKEMNNPKLIGDIIASWKAIAKDKKTIVFASSVAHSISLAQSFIDLGVRAAHIDGGTDNDEREEILEAFNHGNLQVVCNCMVLTEGFDCPPAEICVLARPTKSLGMYLQMIGRVLRPHPGKEKATIIDHSGAVYMHGFVDETVDWRLDPGKSLTIKEKKIEREKEAAEIICEGCFSMFSGSNICPKCGHATEKKSQFMQVIDKELGLVDKVTKEVKKKLKYTEDFKRDFYAMLLGHCMLRGFHSEWAAQTYKKRFKFRPEFSVEPIKPSQECLNYIKYLNIRAAKARNKTTKKYK
jgi:superfamily II DNA or RNA helicase